jgi:glycosyltransferase involved in cell wall biosynthesis
LELVGAPRRDAARPRLRIGIVAPPWVPAPPPAYGGIEQVVALQARGLAEAGHDVTLVAAPGSRVEGVRLLAPLTELPAMIGHASDEWRHVLPASELVEECDVVIDHSGPLGALLAGLGPSAALHVVHGPLDDTMLPVYRALARRVPRLRLVAISEGQRRLGPDLPFAGVCHNGIEVGGMPFRREPGDHLLFLGRMSPDKGADDAIRIARAAGLPLVIAAKCREPEERAYFARHVEPHLGADVTWVGEVGGARKLELLAGARALVFPIRWEEPFGMVMIEAMACGTPVLATPRGSVPEVVADGVTGFVREGPAALAEAAGRLGEIDRRACRRRVAERFSAEAMTAAYERVIAATLRRPRRDAPRPGRWRRRPAATAAGRRRPRYPAAPGDATTAPAAG